MPRNFDFGKKLNSFTIRKIAVHVAEKIERGSASVNKVISALGDVSYFLRAQFGIRDLALVEQFHMDLYALNLADDLLNEDKRRSTTAGYISALNSVFRVFGRPIYISSFQFGISRTTHYDNSNKAATDEVYYAVLDWLFDKYKSSGDIRYQALWHSVRLQRTGGLRFRESVQIKIAGKTFAGNVVRLVKGDGVKNAQPRNIKVRDVSAFVAAQQFVHDYRHIFTTGSLIPGNSKYDNFKWFSYNTIRQINTDIASSGGYHCFRHSFAHDEYRREWMHRTGRDIRCPAESRKIGRVWYDYVIGATSMTNKAQVRAMDKVIRLVVSEKLGHHRIDVTNAYLGGTRARGED